MKALAVIDIAVVFSLAVATTSRADPSVEALLSCSAEYYAREEFNRGLHLTNADYQKFLMDRSNVFLSLAESRAPLESTGCNDDRLGIAMGLVFCKGPASLWTERDMLMRQRLLDLVQTNGGSFPLPTCMEDELCSQCMRTLGELEGFGLK